MAPFSGTTKHYTQDALLELAASHLALLAVSGIGTTKARALVEARGGVAAVAAADDVTGQAVRANLGRARVAVERATALGLAVIPIEHPSYPPALLQGLAGPPAVLFCRGDLPPVLGDSLESLRSCAIVGTRRASSYSLSVADSVARALVDNGVLVVSGLALGVDAAAHRGALAAATLRAPTGAAAATVAVLGGGHEHLHPAEHRRLAADIVAQGGSIISEWAPDVPPARHHFLRRNRLISGLSACVVVVEAARRSGALSTASHALSQSRHLLVVPGRPDDPRYRGCLGLIRDGAAVFLETADVLAAFGIHEPVSAHLPKGPVLDRDLDSGSTRRTGIPWSSPLTRVDMGPLAATLKSLLSTEAEVALDSLLVKVNRVIEADPPAASPAHLSVADLTALLTAMQLAGEVEPTASGRYRLKRITAA